MAKSTSRGKGISFIAGAIVAVAAIFGLNQFDLGFDGLLGEKGSSIFTKQETTTPAEDETEKTEMITEDYALVISINEDIITVNDEVVDIEALDSLINENTGKKVKITDDSAKHSVWTTVIGKLEDADCIIEKK